MPLMRPPSYPVTYNSQHVRDGLVNVKPQDVEDHEREGWVVVADVSGEVPAGASLSVKDEE